MRRMPALFLALALTACASGTPAPIVVPLRYDSALTSRKFPNPVARLTFNGRTAWFIFDTGAGVHSLARWFVEAAGMELDAGLADAVRAVDGTGAPVPFRAVRNQVGRLADGTTLTLSVALVADFPPEFAAHEVAGLINPQLLARDGKAAALDLRVPELRIESFEAAMRRLAVGRVPAEQVQICGSEEDALVPHLLFAVHATTPRGEGWLQLDTGAAGTSVASESPLVRGLELSPGGAFMGVAGKRQTYSLARGLPLAFAGERLTVDAQVVEAAVADCGRDGFLGLDAMRDCALVFGPESLALACGS